MFSLSKPESAFIEAGVEKGVRNDGRARLDYRSLHLETGVVPTAHGSARVRLDRTHVVVGVKLEVAEPAADAPDRGYIYCSVECSATASDMFMRQGSQDANTELTGAMQRFYESCLDLGALAIIPGRSVWAVFIDVEILDTDGSALDAASAGVRAAVRTAQVPCIHLVGSTDRDEGRDFEVSPDPIDSTRLPADLVPICVSMTKIGRCFIADATVQEELCMSAQVSVAVNANGDICGLVKMGSGSLTPAALSDAIVCAKEIGVQLISRIDAMIA
ncbi:Ribosomal RNA-processing protein 42 [Plasmodiophora brassicae]|uniref:Ribosomal RNA-processing protein 42 n=1 Tax=Plasmodiophora brassicae TaxID=37360 RepID=A0A0G4ILW4_PLABS|nr:hypothetical protein PBRA_004775 [Plasmodiophora brassicae]SPQ93370.1 unnamed protein product [Plasmodiophora brassicae]